MPKKLKAKDLVSLKHPNSRKTKALAKEMKKVDKRNKSKFQTNLKQQLLVDKLLWFQDHLMPDDVPVYTPEQTDTLCRLYLSRFEEELKQIIIKQTTGGRRNRQHANREDIIRMTQKRERIEYDTCGIEIPNVMNSAQLDVLRIWNGDAAYLARFELCRFGKKHLSSMQANNTQNSTTTAATATTNNVEKTDSVPQDTPMVADGNNGEVAQDAQVDQSMQIDKTD